MRIVIHTPFESCTITDLATKTQFLDLMALNSDWIEFQKADSSTMIRKSQISKVEFYVTD